MKDCFTASNVLETFLGFRLRIVGEKGNQEKTFVKLSPEKKEYEYEEKILPANWTAFCILYNDSCVRKRSDDRWSRDAADCNS
jgi:hypothetical protein